MTKDGLKCGGALDAGESLVKANLGRSYSAHKTMFFEVASCSVIAPSR